MRGSRHEPALCNATKPPLAVRCFHRDCRNELPGKGGRSGRAVGVDNVLAAAAALSHAVFRPVPVRATLYGQVARQATRLMLRCLVAQALVQGMKILVPVFGPAPVHQRYRDQLAPRIR